MEGVGLDKHRLQTLGRGGCSTGQGPEAHATAVTGPAQWAPAPMLPSHGRDAHATSATGPAQRAAASLLPLPSPTKYSVTCWVRPPST